MNNTDTPNDLSLQDEFLRRTLSCMAELEKKRISARMAAGRRFAATPPLGLRRLDDRTIEVDPRAWSTVERVFAFAADTPSLRSLHRRLIADGTTLPFGQMLKVVSNPAYVTGRFELPDGRTVDVELERPISADLFACVTRWLVGRKRPRSRPDVAGRE